MTCIEVFKTITKQNHVGSGYFGGNFGFSIIDWQIKTELCFSKMYYLDF